MPRSKEEIKAYLKEYYIKNIDKFREYKQKNKERTREYNKQYWASRKNNEEFRQKEKERTLAWYHANFDKIKDKKNARNRKWASNNKGIINFYTNKRYTAKKQRLPIWLTEDNLKQIKALYKLASSLTKSTGVPWHVDHIIPLQGKNVSGLHVPENLQVIEGVINISKNNRYIDE